MVQLFNGYPFDSAQFSSDGEIPLVRIRDLAAQDFQTYIPGPIPGSCELRNGDLVIGMDGDFNTCLWERGPAALNQRLCALRPRPETDIRWVAYNLPPHLKFINDTQYATTVKHLSSGEVLAIRFAVPNYAEQKAICDFLDCETAKIDAVIAKQGQLISTLREDRIATITHAVTKGLDPDVEIVDIGPDHAPVPKRWVVAPVKRFLRSLDHRRIPLSTTERGARQGEYPYYGASGVIDHVDDYLYDGDLVLVSEDGANLLARRTPIAFVATGKYWVNNHAHILQPIESEPPYFWAHRIESENVAPWVTGSAQPKFTIEALMNMKISAPPTKEDREQIVEYLDRRCATIDALVAKATEVIATMQEYRSALITDAVTGKIDVRGAG